jgi:hypothetical protein
MPRRSGSVALLAAPVTVRYMPARGAGGARQEGGVGERGRRPRARSEARAARHARRHAASLPQRHALGKLSDCRLNCPAAPDSAGTRAKSKSSSPACARRDGGGCEVRGVRVGVRCFNLRDQPWGQRAPRPRPQPPTCTGLAYAWKWQWRMLSLVPPTAVTKVYCPGGSGAVGRPAADATAAATAAASARSTQLRVRDIFTGGSPGGGAAAAGEVVAQALCVRSWGRRRPNSTCVGYRVPGTM